MLTYCSLLECHFRRTVPCSWTTVSDVVDDDLHTVERKAMKTRSDLLGEAVLFAIAIIVVLRLAELYIR